MTKPLTPDNIDDFVKHIKDEYANIDKQKGTMIERAFRGCDSAALMRLRGEIPRKKMFITKPKWRSLNPSIEQLASIKITYLERRFNRNGESPNDVFRHHERDAMHKWLNDNGPMAVYRRAGRYGNNFNL